MCGRYTLTTPGELIAEIFDLPEAPEIDPRYNIPPSTEVATVGEDEEGERGFARLRWGLVPHWADDPSIGNRMINARSETVAEKPAFRAAFKRRRCLILADGFYEWQKVDDGGKQPWYYRLESGDPFAFAGLWAHWEPNEEAAEGGEGPIDSCTILTTSANELVERVHHRMPVILRPEDYDLWLDREVSDRDHLEAVLGPYDPSGMIAYPVSKRVNTPSNDDPEVIEPVGDAEKVGAEGGEEQKELF